METASQKWYERTHTNGKETKGIHRQVQSQSGDGGGQGDKDLGRVGIGLSGSSESDIRLEEAIDSERAGDIYREQERQGQERGGVDGSTLRGDWSAEDGREMAQKKAKSLPVATRRTWVEPRLDYSMRRQCGLAGVPRSGCYYEAAKETEQNRMLMRLIDRQ